MPMTHLDGTASLEARGISLPSAGGVQRLGAELGMGLALFAVHGLALGARFGLASMAVHAAGVPLCVLGVGCLATPALYVGACHAGVTIELAALARAAARATAIAGRALAGLSPVALLLGVTSESVLSAIGFAAVGLSVGFWLWLRALLGELDALLGHSRLGSILTSMFVVFAVLLAVRLCWLVLPLFGAAS